MLNTINNFEICGNKLALKYHPLFLIPSNTQQILLKVHFPQQISQPHLSLPGVAVSILSILNFFSSNSSLYQLETYSQAILIIFNNNVKNYRMEEKKNSHKIKLDRVQTT